MIFTARPAAVAARIEADRRRATGPTRNESLVGTLGDRLGCGLDELTMTTSGTQLARLAPALLNTERGCDSDRGGPASWLFEEPSSYLEHHKSRRTNIHGGRRSSRPGRLPAAACKGSRLTSENRLRLDLFFKTASFEAQTQLRKLNTFLVHLEYPDPFLSAKCPPEALRRPDRVVAELGCLTEGCLGRSDLVTNASFKDEIGVHLEALRSTAFVRSACLREQGLGAGCGRWHGIGCSWPTTSRPHSVQVR